MELTDTKFRRLPRTAAVHPHSYNIQYQLSSAEYERWKQHDYTFLAYQLEVTLHGEPVSNSPYKLQVQSPGIFDRISGGLSRSLAFDGIPDNPYYDFFCDTKRKMYRPTSVDQDLHCALLSKAIYDAPSISFEVFSIIHHRAKDMACGEPVEWAVSSRPVDESDGCDIFVVFKGTIDANDILTDLNLQPHNVHLCSCPELEYPIGFPELMVHGGFLATARQALFSVPRKGAEGDRTVKLLSYLLELKRTKRVRHVYVTGHSLGGALAQIVSLFLIAVPGFGGDIVRTVTFAAPMVCFKQPGETREEMIRLNPVFAQWCSGCKNFVFEMDPIAFYPCLPETLVKALFKSYVTANIGMLRPVVETRLRQRMVDALQNVGYRKHYTVAAEKSIFCVKGQLIEGPGGGGGLD